MNNLKLINYRIPFAEYEDVRTLSCGYGFTVFSTHGSKDRVFGCGFNSDGQIGYHERIKGRPLGKDIQGESKKSVIHGACYKSVPFSVQLFCMGFFQYFLKIFIFFGTPMVLKKIHESFFSQNQKFRKAKMCK